MLNKLDFIDLLSIASFVIALMNLEENLTQGDKQDLEEKFNEKLDLLLTEIHNHLQQQDDKLYKIIEILKSKGEEMI